MEILDGSIGKNNAVVRVKVSFLGNGSIKELSNAFLVVGSDVATNGLRIFWNLVGLAFMVAAAAVLTGRWRAATDPARRVLTPYRTIR